MIADWFGFWVVAVIFVFAFGLFLAFSWEAIKRAIRWLVN